MSPMVKILIGLGAVTGMTWIHHAPMGNGDALVDALEAQARTQIAETEIPGIKVALGRDPLSRMATLSGQADRFQREGQGELRGLNDRVRDVPGLSAIEWTDEPRKKAVPLFLETLAMTVLAYLLGLGLAILLWRRRERDSYL